MDFIFRKTSIETFVQLDILFAVTCSKEKIRTYPKTTRDFNFIQMNTVS